MEKFERLHNSDAARLTDADGETLVVGGRLLREIAREIASDLPLEELAFILRQAADKEWAQAGTDIKHKKIASEVHEVAARLQGISLRLYE